MAKRKGAKPSSAKRSLNRGSVQVNGNSATPNPFEQIYQRKKFDLLGKTHKGRVNSSLQAREAGNNKRKSTLLVEYRQSLKANAFNDRRFGEGDEEMTEEERNVLRFQKQRMKEATADRFALRDDDGDATIRLTHLGRSLAEFDDDMPLLAADDDDGDDATHNAQLTSQINFGGGFLPKAGRNTAETPQHQSKKQVMEEIIAKSKAGKAERQTQRDDDLRATEALDATFTELLQGSALTSMMRAKGEKPDAEAIQQTEQEARFDRQRRELVFEARSAAGDRTLSAEELIELERLRLEALERQRLKRMRGGDPGGSDSGSDEEDVAPEGGYALRRHKASKAEKKASKESSEVGGDDLEGDFAGSLEGESDSDSESDGSEEEEEGPLQKRQRIRAAGDHELQASFRQASAALLKKHGMEPSKQSTEELAAVDNEGGGASSSEDTRATYSGNSEENAADDKTGGRDSLSTEAARRPVPLPAPEARRPRQTSQPQLVGPLDVSYVPEVPATYADFATLVDGRSAEDMVAIVSRIRAANAATLAADSRRGLQVFYGILVQHFAKLAASSPLPMEHSDALTPLLLSATREVPFYAATVARAWLTRSHQTLSAAIKDPGEDNDFGWPNSSTVLQLRLWATVFPLSDRRHPVATPAALLTGAYLAMCPVMSLRHAALGLLLAGMMVAAAGAGGRYAPEPLNFVADLLALAASAQDDIFSLSCQGEDCPPDDSSSPAPLQLLHILSPTSSHEKEAVTASSPERESSVALSFSILSAAIQLAESAAGAIDGSPAAPEILQPVRNALEALGNVSSLPQGLEALRAHALSKVCAIADTAVSTRRPLVRKSNKALSVKQFNPQFEEDYAPGKDYDPDRDRAAHKRLKRAVQKEKRGAMRELRKDAAFIAAERDKDKAAAKKERRAIGAANFAFMEQQEANMKSGGQGGMWKKKRPKR